MDPLAELDRVINETAQRGGALLIPAFAVGRAQEVIWRLRRLGGAGGPPALTLRFQETAPADLYRPW